MEKAGWGERLKARARELGLSDAGVARLLDMPQRRYSAYANEARSPDYRTLIAICRALRTTPDAVLGFAQHPPAGPQDGVEVRVRSVLAGMRPAEREKALEVLEAMAGVRSRKPNGTGAAKRPGAGRTTRARRAT